MKVFDHSSKQVIKCSGYDSDGCAACLFYRPTRKSREEVKSDPYLCKFTDEDLTQITCSHVKRTVGWEIIKTYENI